MEDIRTCPECGKKVNRDCMEFSRDCYGIPFRLLCVDCWEKIEEEKGYDGVFYGPADENIDYY